jgi:hypothetical protein
MSSTTIAYFVTPHGFGHAARAAAVMEALGRLDRQINFEIVTTIPEWFFTQSLSVPYRIRPVVCDVGFVQRDAIHEDLRATAVALERLWSGLGDKAAELIREWGDEPPRLVVSDISPMGLEVARRLDVPSVLVENFTWDWIYAAYFEQAPELRAFARRSAELSALATIHIQCSPMCEPLAEATVVSPVSRTSELDAAKTRRALGLDDADDRPLVLLTMGGLGWELELPDLGESVLFATLGGGDRLSREGNLIRLPDRSPIYPPDLIRAADAVVGKLGYSTVAECYQAGSRMGFIRRPGFPESPVLEAFVRENLQSVELEIGSAGPPTSSWLGGLSVLMTQPRGSRRTTNGSDEIAALLLTLLE